MVLWKISSPNIQQPRAAQRLWISVLEARTRGYDKSSTDTGSDILLVVVDSRIRMLEDVKDKQHFLFYGSDGRIYT